MNKLIIRILGGVGALAYCNMQYEVWASNLRTSICIGVSIWLTIGFLWCLRAAIYGSLEATS
jgi:hypothetical protein